MGWKLKIVSRTFNLWDDKNKTCDFLDIEAMLVLGDKYMFHHLYKEAVSCYEMTFPSTYAKFTALPTTTAFSTVKFKLDSQSTKCDVVNIAIHHGLEKCLPAIFYLILIDKEFTVMSHHWPEY